MPELERLHAGHAPAVLAFELANRAYFAAHSVKRQSGTWS
jgi:[ribosomal protein S5]-alanine N-acetyltransferase